MLSFFVLAAGKGLFGWLTVEPDSNGWQVCYNRLHASKYPVEWYAQERSTLDILMMDPRSRLCADMMWSGHTYFVCIFAFGLWECTHTALRYYETKNRLAFEFLVVAGATFQQSVEIYFVLKSRFHYTSDVVMALFVTYLLYSNGTIAVTAMWWLHTGNYKKAASGLQEPGEDKSPWVNTMHSVGSVSVGCCCFGQESMHQIYSRDQLTYIMALAKKATDPAVSRLAAQYQFQERTAEEIMDQMVMQRPPKFELPDIKSPGKAKQLAEAEQSKCTIL